MQQHGRHVIRTDRVNAFTKGEEFRPQTKISKESYSSCTVEFLSFDGQQVPNGRNQKNSLHNTRRVTQLTNVIRTLHTKNYTRFPHNSSRE